jgi:hypothetical protein
VDCRSEDEFNGGHIQGAINVVFPEKLDALLFDAAGEPLLSSRTAIIVHCEFSSVRGPRCWKVIRERDRNLNATFYPNLHYPQLYVLQNGYKCFYEQFKVGGLDKLLLSLLPPFSGAFFFLRFFFFFFLLNLFSFLQPLCVTKL